MNDEEQFSALELERHDGSEASPRIKRHLIAADDLHTHRVTDFEPNALITVGREEPFEYEGRMHHSVSDEWDGLMRIIDKRSACASFWLDGRDVFSIPWDDFSRLLRASVASRKHRAGDIELVEPHELDFDPGLGYSIRMDGVVTLRDAYDRARAIEREVLAPIHQVQLRLAEAVEKAELTLQGGDRSLAGLLAAAQGATSADEKGTSLERLIGALFRTIPQMQVASVRCRTATEEIDLLVLNQRDDARWRGEGFYIPVECKNWSTRCGKDEVVVFVSKLRNRKGRASCGVFVSWNGFTSASRTELLRDSAGHYIVILLTGDDIVRAVREGDFLGVLEKRLDEAVLT